MISAIRTTEHLAVKINVSAPSGPEVQGQGRRPLNVAFLIDNSGSMDGERLTSVKRTLVAARELFIPTDRVTLVTFEDKAAVVADHLLLDEAGISEFYAAIDGIQAKGCTNLSAGFEELLILQQGEAYDAVLLLTDGQINQGITSNVGLRTMRPLSAITALGYGSDHNRILLRDLATASRGAYIFVDAEAILPEAMGLFIGGLRAEVLRDASIQVPSGWTCIEPACTGPSSSYMVGNIVADRDYWVVFKRSGLGQGGQSEEDGPVILSTDKRQQPRVSLHLIPYSDCHELQEQVLRCRVSTAITAASDRMEAGARIDGTLAALAVEFAALSPEMLQRPLVLRMAAQVAEVLDQSTRGPEDRPALLARMSSGAATLSSQRGSNHYSSPCQRTASNQVSSHYSHQSSGQDDPV